MTSHHQVLIIGSGPAGLTAAIYAARANLNPLLIEGELSSTSDQPGGQLMLTTEVENFPGFPEGIMGPELMGSFKKQAERFGTQFVSGKAVKVEFASSGVHKVWVNAKNAANGGEPEYSADAVIISTGARSMMLNIPRETELIGHGVSTCATCDGFFFRGKQIAVVGGGDSALEEALFLTKFADSVTIIHRRDELRASKIMQDRVKTNPKISFLWSSQVVELLGDASLSGIVVEDLKTNLCRTIDVSGLFVAIGHAPNTDLFKGLIDTDAAGYIKTVPGRSLTNVEGVFACGDVQDHIYRQAITAAGSGCMAAIDAERWLSESR